MKFLLLLSLTFLVYCSDNKAKSVGNSLSQVPDLAVKIKPVEKDTVIVQTRFYKDLSFINNYKLTYSTHFKNTKSERCYRSIEVFDKVNDKRKDSISLEIPAFMSYGEDITETRSYITGKNKNKQLVDNYAGDFIVADLNFDGREDFALPSESGASVGPYSVFYVQNEEGKFIRDIFLSDSVTVFPNEIHPKKRILVTYIHAGVCGVGQHKYKLNKANQWHQISHTYRNICDD
jgi:hypothetical protein